MNKENLEKIIQLRHTLHAHPELSLQEVHTKERLEAFLKQHTNLEVVDKGAWFYAHYDSGRKDAPTLAFRADFDALPIQETCEIPYASVTEGVGHKCGHDGHSAALAGFALEVAQEQPPQNVYFIFQHGEEVGKGGEECAKLLPQIGCQWIYAVHNLSGHPQGTILYRRGLSQCASKGLTIFFQGQNAHASQPEDGKNPAFAITALVQYIYRLLAENKYEDMVLCTLVHIEAGSKNFGISAGEGQVSMTLRANREADMELLEQQILQYAKELADREGLQIRQEEVDPFPETRNHDAAIEKVLAAADSLGLQTEELKQPWRASEDFGYYTKVCPGAIFYVGNGEDYPPLHTGEYDFNDGILEEIVDMYSEILRQTH